MSNISDDTVLWESYPVHRSSDFITLPENRAELDYVSHDPLDTSDILNICTATVGVVGNSMTLLIIILSKKLRTIPNIFVAHLAVIDLLVCGSMIATLMIRTHAICQFLAPVIILFMGQSLFSMAYIAANRYVLICRDKGLYNKIYIPRNICLMVLGGYLYMGVALSPPYFGLGSYTYNVKFQCCYIGAYDLYAYIHGCVLILLFMAPVMVLIIFCYAKIINKFRISHSNMKKQSTAAAPARFCNDSDLTPTSESPSDGQKTFTDKKKPEQTKSAVARLRKKDVRAFKTILSMLVIFVIFIIAWLPSETAYLIDFYGRLPARLHTHLIAIAWLNSANNVFVYALLNRNFREAYKKLLTCDWRKM